MNILDVIKNRRSVRDFTDRKIPKSAIDILVEVLRWAPSAGNLQSRKFYFVFNEDIRKKLAGTELKPGLIRFIARAPLVIVACADENIAARYKERGKNLYCIQDTAVSLQNLLLAAYDLGLGTCWVGAFNEEHVREVLNLPDTLRPVAIVPVGYPACIPNAPDRVSRKAAIEFVL